MDRFTFELAGVLGLDPSPFTLRELFVMAEARSRALWNHTASVLALLANAHRDPKRTRPFTPSDFHPHHRRKPSPAAKVGITALKSVFVDRPPGGQ